MVLAIALINKALVAEAASEDILLRRSYPHQSISLVTGQKQSGEMLVWTDSSNCCPRGSDGLYCCRRFSC